MAYFYRYEYDVVLSFAAADRNAAEEMARLLVGRNVKVSLSEYSEHQDILAYLADLFGKRARFYLLLFSGAFPLPAWTEVERLAAQIRSEPEIPYTLLPVRMDDREIPGLENANAARDLRAHAGADIADMLTDTLVKEKGHPGPPPQSHDLRSGNVPSAGEENES